MYFAGYDLLISHYVSKVFLLLLFHGFQATFLHILQLKVKIYSGLDRVINHVMHDTSLVELLCKIRRYSSKIPFTYLVGRFLLIEEVGVKKSNLASATL